MNPTIFVNGKPYPLLSDLRFEILMHFPRDVALFDMGTTPATEVEVTELGVTRKKLLPHGHYSAFSRVREGFRPHFSPACAFVMNLPPGTTSAMLRDFFGKFDRVRHAEVFCFADGVSSSRGWVSFHNPSALLRIPKVLDFSDNAGTAHILVELSDKVPESREKVIEAPRHEDRRGGEYGSSLHVDAARRPAPLSSLPSDYSTHTPSRLPASPAPDAVNRPSGLRNKAFKGPAMSPMERERTNERGDFPVERGYKKRRFFIVHVCDEEARNAVHDRCFTPQFQADRLFSTGDEELLLIFTVNNKSLFFGMAKLLPRKRGPPMSKLPLQWISSFLYAPVSEVERDAGSLLALNGAEVPYDLGQRIASYLEMYTERPEVGLSPVDRRPMHTMKSPAGDGPRRGRGRGYHSGRGRGLPVGGREPRPIGDDIGPRRPRNGM